MNKLLQLAIACGLAACGPDDHLTTGDANGSDSGDTNNTAAYARLFQ